MKFNYIYGKQAEQYDYLYIPKAFMKEEPFKTMTASAKIMYADADAATINEKAAEYAALQSSAEAAAKRGYVDTIIEAEDTRKYVIGAFEMLFTKREDRPAKKHGTV